MPGANENIRTRAYDEAPIKVPDGKIYFVDRKGGRVVRIDP